MDIGYPECYITKNDIKVFLRFLKKRVKKKQGNSETTKQQNNKTTKQ